MACIHCNLVSKSSNVVLQIAAIAVTFCMHMMGVSLSVHTISGIVEDLLSLAYHPVRVWLFEIANTLAANS